MTLNTPLSTAGQLLSEKQRSEDLLRGFHHAYAHTFNAGVEMLKCPDISLSTKVRELDALRERFEELENLLGSMEP